MHATLLLREPVSAYRAITGLWQQIKGSLLTGGKVEVVVRPERRTSEANARFHAICTDLERSRFPWFGHPRSKEDWKVLLVSGHAVVTKEGANVLPGIEGELVNLRESTALMSKARSRSLIDYSEAFCVTNGVPLRDPVSLQAEHGAAEAA